MSPLPPYIMAGVCKMALHKDIFNYLTSYIFCWTILLDINHWIKAQNRHWGFPYTPWKPFDCFCKLKCWLLKICFVFIKPSHICPYESNNFEMHFQKLLKYLMCLEFTCRAGTNFQRKLHLNAEKNLNKFHRPFCFHTPFQWVQFLNSFQMITFINKLIYLLRWRDPIWYLWP